MLTGVLFRCKNVSFVRQPSFLGFTAHKRVIFTEITSVPCLKFWDVHSGNKNKISLGGAFVYLEGLPIVYINAVVHMYVFLRSCTRARPHFSLQQQPLVLLGGEFGVGSNDLQLRL